MNGTHFKILCYIHFANFFLPAMLCKSEKINVICFSLNYIPISSSRGTQSTKSAATHSFLCSLELPSMQRDCPLLTPSTCFPRSSVGKESACSSGDPGLIPGSGRSPGEGNGNPLQYSRLENPMDRGAWQVTVHGVTRVGLSDSTTTTQLMGQKMNSFKFKAWGFSGGPVVKNSPADAGDARHSGSIPGSGRSPGGGNGNQLQYSCLENPHGQRSLAGYSPLGHKESNRTE